jgi:hypothetical protein
MPLLFYIFYIRKRFPSAFALYKYFPRINNKYSQNVCYRLGLYNKVANTPLYSGKNWRGGFALIVSLYACGRNEDAKIQVDEWLKLGFNDQLRAELADCIAPFNPELAFRLLPDEKAPVTLRAALCLKNGYSHKASEILSKYLLAHSDATEIPETWLYYSNALNNQSSTEKLYFLNRFLVSRQVSRLRLLDVSQMPGPKNIESAEICPAIRGPLVSVLMTGYNSAKRIGSAIWSLLTQSYQDIEIIVVDDASSDTTCDIVGKFMKDDNRVMLVRLPCNIGTYAAKNIGLQYASGEFVTCHDSDDWAHPLKIERQVVPLLKNRKLICTTSDWIRMQDDGIFYARAVHPLQRFNPSSPLFRKKEVLEKAGAWDWVRTGADSEFAARLKLVFGRKAVLRIKQPLTIGAHRPGSLMTDPATGYISGRVPPDRLEYWESWTYWHIDELRAGRKPRMPDMLSARVFKAPESISVPLGHIVENLNTIQEQCRNHDHLA